MSNSEHLQLVRQGSAAINAWRENRNLVTLLELNGADLEGIDLKNANLGRADLAGATLTDANLSGANLSHIDFTNAKLNRANLSNAIIYDTTFTGADLSGTTFSPLQFTVQGDAQQGKTTLTEALEKQKSEDSKRFLKFVDMPTQAERLSLLGNTAGAIVVIGTVDGIMNYAREAIQKAGEKKVQPLFVFCNKLDLNDDEDDLELVTMDIENVLEQNSLQHVDIKKGSALQALDGNADSIKTIKELLTDIERRVAANWSPPN
jgi:signal recognition particle receptor subunit beta